MWQAYRDFYQNSFNTNDFVNVNISAIQNTLNLEKKLKFIQFHS